MIEATPFLISKVIQICLIFVLLKGIFTMSKSLKEMEEKYRKSLIIILLSLVTYVLLAISFSILLYQRTNYDSYFWLLPPAIGLIGAFILVLGGKKLLQAMNSPEEE